MDIKEIVLELTRLVRNDVLPHLGKMPSRAPLSKGASGDTTFAIDEVAEEKTESFLKKVGNIAYYSEDKGMQIFGKPDYVLVVDPIDGTRPAAAGLESCCVSVAAASYEREPKMKDVALGAVLEIKSGTLFLAEKDKGILIERGNQRLEVSLSDNTKLSNLFWCIGFRGRPAEALITVLGDLVDMSSVDGGLFDLGSASFSMTRLVSGQMDAYIDIGKRMIEEVPAVEKEFLRVGGGEVLNNNPYDVAAAVLVAREAGCVITDGYGQSLGNYPLLGAGPDFQFSVVGATSQVLHQRVMTETDKGIKKLKERFKD